MLRQNRSCGACVAAKQKFGFGVLLGRNGSPMGACQGRKNNHKNKRGYSAEGYSLLTSALRPRLFGVGIILGAVMIIGASLGAYNNTSAVSATLSIPDNVSVNINPTLNDGFAESTPGSVSVSTSNLAGYTLSIKSKNNSNDLISELDSNAKLTSITTELSTEQYKTGDYVNTWGFKPSIVNNSDNNSYVPGPTSSGITLAKTNSDSALDNINLAIAAKIDSNTITGNYTNTFVLTAVANEAKYNIILNKNGGTGGPSTGTANYTQTGDIGANTYVKIKSGEPTKSGVDFLGWCSVNPGTSDVCNGVLVQSDGQFPLCKCDLSITLYAMYGTKPKAPGTNGADCTVAGHSGKYYGGLCWQWTDASGSSNWNEAKTVCNSMGWSLPTQEQFQTLVNSIGSGNQLYNAGWKGGDYWSSTAYSKGAYYLVVSSNNAYVTNGKNDYYNGYKSTTLSSSVRCVSQ